MSQAQQFAIKTNVFEGPLELLLDLIEKRKLLINDISLATVTDEYMQYVATLQEETDTHPLRETSQFVLVASTLLLIKSKSLLPVLSLTSEETASIEDLEYRLKLYQIYREARRGVIQRFGKVMLYDRQFVGDDTPLFLTDTYTQKDALHKALVELIERLPKKVVKKAVSVKKVVSLEEMIDKLKERITHQFQLSFADFSGKSSEKTTVIVSFLAVLELVKQGEVMVKQEGKYSDLEIQKERVDTPRYS